MKEIVINSNQAGQRIDKFLSKYLNEAPNSFIYKMLRKKNITLNGKKATGNEKLSVNDVVKLFLADETIEKFSSNSVQKTKYDLNIVYEDDNVLFLNKAAGVLSQKSQSGESSINEEIISYLLDKGTLTKDELNSFKPSVCNRLDRNTSGLITAGKTLLGLQNMASFFKERLGDKYYRCVVLGEIDKKELVCGYLLKDEITNKVQIFKENVPNSSYIMTEYSPVSSNNGYTLLEVKLITGKTHQIRAHLASVGHPIIGDIKYGNKRINKEMQDKYKLKYQLLHSYSLHIKQGTFKDCMSNLNDKIFTAKEPKYFINILKDLKLI